MSVGQPAPAEDIWLRFLEKVVAGLREAGRRIRGDLRPHYEGRPGWLGEPRIGLHGTRIPAEPAISQALVEVLRRMRADQVIQGNAPVPGLDLSRMEFGTEEPRRHEVGIGARALPTDIMIVQDDLDLRIEAKTILTDADLRREYLGERGLRRFDDVRSPYSSERYGSMLAYVMNGDVRGWSAMIEAAIRDAQPAFLILRAELSGESFIATRHERLIDSPEHGLRERRTTEVIHLILEFDAVPTLRTAAL